MLFQIPILQVLIIASYHSILVFYLWLLCQQEDCTTTLQANNSKNSSPYNTIYIDCYDVNQGY